MLEFMNVQFTSVRISSEIELEDYCIAREMRKDLKRKPLLHCEDSGGNHGVRESILFGVARGALESAIHHCYQCWGGLIQFFFMAG
jgi:hypothetical protein